MRRGRFISVTGLVGGVLAGLLAHSGCSASGANETVAAALTGTVRSPEEGPMEGVLVSAKKAGSNITVTVVSDPQGRYRFPRERLTAGRYALSVRAVEYELPGPMEVQVGAEQAATADLGLRKAPGTGLTNREWILSVPQEEQKDALRDQQCVRCHTLERVVRSQYTAEDWTPVLQRMAAYTTNSGANAPPQVSPDAEEMLAKPPSDRVVQRAKILASLNLSSGPKLPFQVRTLPRPKGRATQVIYTEYDLPETTRQPHDVIIDSEGVVWYNDFGDQLIGRLDPATGKVKEFPLPVLDPEETKGTLSIRFDRDENIWIGMFYQAAIAKFDRKTEKLEVFQLPADLKAKGRGGRARLTEVSPQSAHVDGKVWVVNSEIMGMHRFDLATRKWEIFQPFPEKPVNIYDAIPDSQNNACFLAFGAEHVGFIAAGSGKIEVYPTPTKGSRPRRGSMDSLDRCWFGEHNGDRVGMLDMRTKKIQEWKLATDTFPYDAIADKNGHVWSGGMYSDRVQRLDPRTGEVTEYLLPRSTNIRRVYVQNGPRVAFWVGSNHGASIVKLEALDTATSREPTP